MDLKKELQTVKTAQLESYLEQKITVIPMKNKKYLSSQLQISFKSKLKRSISP